MRTPVPASRKIWRSLRMSPGPFAWGAVSVLVLLASYPLGLLRAWHGFLLAIPFLLATAGFGWRAGVVLAPVGLGLLWLRSVMGGEPAQLGDIAMLTISMGLATAGGDRLYLSWRRAERSARHAGRRARLLQAATVDLNHATSEDEVYSSAPRLLSDILPFSHGSVFVPCSTGLLVHSVWGWDVAPGFVVPLSSVMGRAFLAREPLYVPDTALDPDFIQAPGAEATRSELALPIVTGGRVRAVLNLEHTSTNAFDKGDHATLSAFVRMMAEVIARLDATQALSESTSEQHFMARLNKRLLLAETYAEAAGVALEEIVTHFGFDVGAVLELHHGRLRTVRLHGEPPPVLAERLREGFGFESVLRHAWESRKLVIVDDLSLDPNWSTTTEARALALVPIVDPSGQMQALVALTRYRDPLPTWNERARALLSEVSVPLGAAFARATLNRQLVATLDAIKLLKSASGPEALYHHAAEAVLDLVPNAEAVSILVRHGDHYHYEAAIGYDLEYLQAESGPFTYEEQLIWYRGSVEEFEAGHGRILRGSDVLEASTQAELSPAHKAENRVHEIRCQLAVPIVDQGGLVALLNIDNFSTEDAFGPAALRVAEAFAQHIIVVVHEAEKMHELERTAATDALTGLGNRSSFDRTFKHELARARRYEHHLSLVLVDLNDFKLINDRFGHPEGDKALVTVAEALRRATRATDLVFRWGGDEFAILMPEVARGRAEEAARRIGDVVGGLAVGSVKLSAAVGVASYPGDGLDRETLMASADHRMYVQKRGERGATKRQASRSSFSSRPAAPAAGAGSEPPEADRQATPPPPPGAPPVKAGRDNR